MLQLLPSLIALRQTYDLEPLLAELLGRYLDTSPATATAINTTGAAEREARRRLARAGELQGLVRAFRPAPARPPRRRPSPIPHRQPRRQP